MWSVNLIGLLVETDEKSSQEKGLDDIAFGSEAAEVLLQLIQGATEEVVVLFDAVDDGTVDVELPEVFLSLWRQDDLGLAIVALIAVLGTVLLHPLELKEVLFGEVGPLVPDDHVLDLGETEAVAVVLFLAQEIVEGLFLDDGEGVGREEVALSAIEAGREIDFLLLLYGLLELVIDVLEEDLLPLVLRQGTIAGKEPSEIFGESRFGKENFLHVVDCVEAHRGGKEGEAHGVVNHS